MTQVTEIHQVMSTDKKGNEYVESTWYDKDDAQSIVDDMDDDYFTFHVATRVILGKPKPVVHSGTKPEDGHKIPEREIDSLLGNVLYGR